MAALEGRTTEITWRTAVSLLVAMTVADTVMETLTNNGGLSVAWWSALGLSVAAVAASPRKWWPWLLVGIVVSQTVARSIHGQPLDTSVLLGVAHASEALVAGMLLRSAAPSRPPRLVSQPDVLRLFAAAALVGAIATLVEGVAILRPAGLISGQFNAVFASHTASILVFVPLVLLHRHWSGSASRNEILLQSGLLVATLLFIFIPQDIGPLPFFPIPLLIWGAMRLPIAAITGEVTLMTLIVTTATANDRGPLSLATEAMDLSQAVLATLTQGFIAAAVVMTLPLAVSMAEQKTLVTALSRDERRFRTNFTESSMGMLFLRADEGGGLVIETSNAAARDMLALDEDRLRGRKLEDAVDVLPQTKRSLDLLQHGLVSTWHGQSGASNRPGSRLNISVTALHTEPDPPLYSAQLLDVTQEYDARRRLEAAHKFTDATLDSAGCVMLVTDSDGRLVRVNAATKHITGYSEAELLGVPIWHTSFSPLDQAGIESLFIWPNRSGLPMASERAALAKDGSPLRLVWSCNVVQDELGLPHNAVLTGVDVTTERTTAGLMTHLMQASIGTAIVGVDTMGKITVFNSGAQHLVGHRPEDMVGRPFTDLLNHQTLLERTGTASPGEAFVSLVGGIGDEGESSAGDWEWVTSDGESIPVSMTLSLTTDTVSGRIGFLCIGRDVTEQREAQETLAAALLKERSAVQQLRALDQAKDNFVSTVSHELRTPVTSIVGYTEMLQDGSVVPASADQLPLLDVIARNGQRLIVICNDLLMLSGLDTAAPRLTVRRVDVAEILRGAEESVRPLLRDRELNFSVSAPQGPVYVSGDRSQLDRVAANLLSNAIKFTPDGGTIRASVGVGKEDAFLLVRDSGIGIAAEEHGQVFQRFFRTSAAEERAIQGTGLGLSIVAAIVEAHGGTIELDSEPGQGSTFSVRLPLQRERG